MEMDENLRMALDSVAKEGFRDVADYDYIGARVSFRLHLRDQFYWSALQALEKYLKAILLFNGVKVKDISHSLQKLYRRVLERTGFEISLNENQKQFLSIIEKFGNNRYRTKESRIIGHELFEFDQLVWMIRHYALSTNLIVDGVTKTEWYVNNLAPPDERETPTINQLIDGELEKILSHDASNPHRQELVWCNRYYGWTENATQIPEIVRSSSHIPVYERDWFKNKFVEYKKPLADALRDFVKYP